MNAETLYPRLKKFLHEIEKEFNTIPSERISILNRLTAYIDAKDGKNEDVNLTFICTHNSRRSHITQLWAQTAAYVYGIENAFCFSGGTEATAFNPRAVKAMENAGFKITIEKEGDNPIYNVRFSDDAPAIKAFSKFFDDPINPRKNFAAVMTCSHADENCPFIPGADARIPLTYDDPKDFDGTEFEEEKYRERVREIGREMMFAVSRAKSRKLKA
jgi:protein-tyrosine-phosphatase